MCISLSLGVSQSITLSSQYCRFPHYFSSYQLIDCYPIININRRSRIPQADGRVVYEDVGSEEKNDCPFPFEPYLLRLSGIYINGNNAYLNHQGTRRFRGFGFCRCCCCFPANNRAQNKKTMDPAWRGGVLDCDISTSSQVSAEARRRRCRAPDWAVRARWPPAWLSWCPPG